MFLKNRNIIFKMKISKVTDYAALTKNYGHGKLVQLVFVNHMSNLKNNILAFLLSASIVKSYYYASLKRQYPLFEL